MKKHRFRFSKESRDRLEQFDAQSELNGRGQAAPDPQETAPEAAQAPAQPEAPAAREDAFVVVTRTDVGKLRANNEDCIISDGLLHGVADGMGGHQGGEVASAMTRDLLIEKLSGEEPDPEKLRQAICTANRRVFVRQAEDEALSGMGTTLSVMWVADVSIYIGHVGDSRIYRLRDGELRQITEDHSLVMEMVRAGMITREQAEVHPMKNVILRAIGTEGSIQADLLQSVRQKGDVWLACSDGLCDMVPDSTIEKILSENGPEEAADLLMQEALDAGGRDNVTLVILKDLGEAE